HRAGRSRWCAASWSASERSPARPGRWSTGHSRPSTPCIRARSPVRSTPARRPPPRRRQRPRLPRGAKGTGAIDPGLFLFGSGGFGACFLIVGVVPQEVPGGLDHLATDLFVPARRPAKGHLVLQHEDVIDPEPQLEDAPGETAREARTRSSRVHHVAVLSGEAAVGVDEQQVAHLHGSTNIDVLTHWSVIVTHPPRRPEGSPMRWTLTRLVEARTLGGTPATITTFSPSSTVPDCSRRAAASAISSSVDPLRSKGCGVTPQKSDMRLRVDSSGLKACPRCSGRYLEMSRAVDPDSVKATMNRALTLSAI